MPRPAAFLHKDISSSGPSVFVIVMGALTRLPGDRRTGLPEQLFTLLIDAQHRLLRIVRSCIQPQQRVYILSRYSAVIRPMHRISLRQGLRSLFLTSGAPSPD
jgi:hypothetical protein